MKKKKKNAFAPEATASPILYCVLYLHMYNACDWYGYTTCQKNYINKTSLILLVNIYANIFVLIDRKLLLLFTITQNIQTTTERKYLHKSCGKTLRAIMRELSRDELKKKWVYRCDFCPCDTNGCYSVVDIAAGMDNKAFPRMGVWVSSGAPLLLMFPVCASSWCIHPTPSSTSRRRKKVSF